MLAVSPGSSVGYGFGGLGASANSVVLDQFVVKLRNNPDATFFVSPGSSGGSGTVNGFRYIVLALSEFEAVNQAMSAAGNAALIAKPVKGAALIERLPSLITLRQARRARRRERRIFPSATRESGDG